MSQIGSVVDCWWVVDQGSGSRDDSGMSTEDSGSSNKGKMGSCGFSNLWGNLDWLGGNTGVHWGNKGLWVEGGGNKRLWVEGGSNAGIDWSNGQTRVSNAESSCISNILNLLKLTIGINIRVSTGDSAISV